MSEELSIVKAVGKDQMIISWDLGRRCNYDCTYCPAHRHDNVSPHAELTELSKTAGFVYEYLELLMEFRKHKQVSISFTGGEPTVNPNFINFCKWLREEYNEKYKDLYRLNLSLTSNGATSKKVCDAIIENLNFITISYHCEGTDRLKEMVKENILYFNEKKFPMKINVMFHGRKDYFKECIELCKDLRKNNIEFVPRMIGEYEDNNKYHHKYDQSQMNWMKNYWKTNEITDLESAEGSIAIKSKENKNTEVCGEKKTTEVSDDKKNARSLGRPCCGKREMSVCNKDKTKWTNTTFLSFAKFEKWYCSVNWFFLHIEQQTKLIYHHQTCQADFGGKRGSIGSTDNTKPILDNLRKNLSERKMPIIVCPNKICGCGLCTPKAKNFDDFMKTLPGHVDVGVFDKNITQEHIVT